MDEKTLLDAIKSIVKEETTPINQRLDKIDQRFDKMDQRFDKMDQRLGKMDQRFDKMEEGQSRLEQRVSKTELMIENTVIPAIGLLAEGQKTIQEQIKNLSVIDQMQGDISLLKAAVKHLSGEVESLKNAI